MEFESFDALQAKSSLKKLPKPALVGIFLLITALLASGALSLANAHNATAVVVSTSSDTPLIDGEIEANSISDQASASGLHDDEQAIYVHVAGEVCNPGFYKLDASSRVNDAVQAAGGFTENADTSSINLARRISDGEQLVVLSLRDNTVQAQIDSIDTPSDQSSASDAYQGIALVNVNRATAVELQSVPGIGPSTAQKIVEDRKSHGPYSALQDLTRVSGIGDKKLEAISPYLTVG